MKKDEARDSREAPRDMTETSTVATVSALMEERRKFEGWISALEAKRSGTPDHVFTRVHADYSARLDSVLEQLTSHGDALRTEIDDLTSRIGSLKSEHQEVGDERAEAELRAHVGELSETDWKRTAEQADTRLRDISEKQTSLELDLTRTLELLGDAQRRIPQSVEASTTTPSAEGDASPASNGSPRGSAGAEQETIAPAGDSADADMHVPAAEDVSKDAAGATSAPRTSGARPADQHTLAIEEPARPAARTTGFDELAFLSSVVDAPAGAVEPRPQDEGDEATRMRSFARHSRVASAMTDVPDMTPPRQLAAIEIEREETPAIGPSSMPEVSRSLKCGECGAMNYPTEWYCEKCGAELASL